jgi:hypothetical protein
MPVVQVVEDPDHPGELLLNLGHELCAEIGWKVGDTVQWIDQKDGTWLIIKSASTNTSLKTTQE